MLSYIMVNKLLKLSNMFILNLFLMNVIPIIILVDNPKVVDKILPKVRAYPIRYTVFINGNSNITFKIKPVNKIISTLLFLLYLILMLITKVYNI